MVECDFGSIEEQQRYISLLEVPYSCVTFSGSKSLHFVICLDTSLKDEAEYRKYSSAILKICSKADQSTKNPSRYTRLAGAVRADTSKVQELVELRERISKEQLDKWIKSHNVGLNSPRVAPPLASNGFRKVLHIDTRNFLLNGAARGNINNQAFISSMNLLECGYSLEYTQYQVKRTGEEYGYNLGELEKVVQSAYRKFSQSR